MITGFNFSEEWTTQEELRGLAVRGILIPLPENTWSALKDERHAPASCLIYSSHLSF